MTQLLILLVIFSFSPAQAGIVKAQNSTGYVMTKNLSVDNLIDRAGIIFRGRVESIKNAKHKGMSVREMNFAVVDAIKGVDSKTITLREWSRAKSPVTEAKKGESYVFFFHKPSSLGLTSLIGMDQGIVAIEKTGELKFSPRLSLAPSYSHFKFSVAGKDIPRADIKTYSGLKEYCALRN